MKKTIKKKPVFTVDITKCETIDDVVIAIIESKIDAEVHVSKMEILTLATAYTFKSVEAIMPMLFLLITSFRPNNLNTKSEEDSKPEVKKPNIFKKILNWFKK